MRMTIYQESSSLVADVAPGTSNAGPTTNKRSIESNVMVDDGQILVLGGLIEDTYTDNQSKVPLLGDIPYLGALFRSESRTQDADQPDGVPAADRACATPRPPNKLSVDRYDLIRASSRSSSRRPSMLMPINEAPVVPPLRRLEDTVAPIAAPQSSPGTTPGALHGPADGRRCPADAADRAAAGRDRPPPRRRRTSASAEAAMGARHPLPYAYAKAHTLLLEDDGARLVLWASETVGAAGALRGAAPLRRRQLRARIGRHAAAASPRPTPAASRAPRRWSARSRARSTCRA